MNISLSCCHVITTIAYIYNMLPYSFGYIICKESLRIIIIIIIQNIGLFYGQSTIVYVFRKCA